MDAMGLIYAKVVEDVAAQEVIEPIRQAQ